MFDKSNIYRIGIDGGPMLLCYNVLPKKPFHSELNSWLIEKKLKKNSWLITSKISSGSIPKISLSPIGCG